MNPIAPQLTTINDTALQTTTSQITNIATDFGGLAVKIVLALFMIYFFYQIIKMLSSRH